jgi:hypothetical protein
VYAIAFEFETEEEMHKVAELLWKKHGVTGELEMYPASSGRFRLHVHSEKQIRDSVLEKLPGKRIQAKGSFGSAAPKEVASEDD